MTGRRSTSRLFSTLSLLLLLAGAGADAADPPLRAYSASYDLHKGSRHVAVTELRLEQMDGYWQWSSITRARGVYAWFVRKQPHTRTRFDRSAGRLRLREIVIADARQEQPEESARFDWDRGEMRVLRKGKQRKERLDGEVYDYQTVHVLAAGMQQRGQQQARIDFYRKGKLVESRLEYQGHERIEVNGKPLRASVFQQVVERSDAVIRYYYDPANPLLPLRIETRERGEKPAVLSLRAADTGS